MRRLTLKSLRAESSTSRPGGQARRRCWCRRRPRCRPRRRTSSPCCQRWPACRRATSRRCRSARWPAGPLDESCEMSCRAACLAWFSLNPDIEPERSITRARFTGDRAAPGTSCARRSTVAKTSWWPSETKGWDRRAVIDRLPSAHRPGRGEVHRIGGGDDGGPREARHSSHERDESQHAGDGEEDTSAIHAKPRERGTNDNPNVVPVARSGATFDLLCEEQASGFSDFAWVKNRASGRCGSGLHAAVGAGAPRAQKLGSRTPAKPPSPA